MSKFDQDKSKYAFVKIYGDWGYGHLDAIIYNLTDITWNGPRLEVTSQIGTSCDAPRTLDEAIYAWRLGASPSCGDTLNLREMEEAIKPLRRIEKKLDKMTEQFGSAKNYPEYLFRVLLAAGVEHVIINPNYGGGYSCQLEDLPRVDMSPSWGKNDLRREIDKLADTLIKKFYPNGIGVKEEAA